MLKARSQNREEHWRFFRASKQDFRAERKNPKQRRTLKVFSCSEKKQEDSPGEGCKKPIQRRFCRSRQEDKTEKKQEAKTYFRDQARRSQNRLEMDKMDIDILEEKPARRSTSSYSYGIKRVHAQKKIQKVCRYWLAGNCKHAGHDCKYLHSFVGGASDVTFLTKLVGHCYKVCLGFLFVSLLYDACSITVDQLSFQ